MRVVYALAMVCVLGCLLALGLAIAQPDLPAKTVSIDSLKDVVKGLGVEMTELETRNRNGTVVYVLNIQAEVDQTGKIVQSSIQIATTAVPENVMDVAKKLVPVGKAEMARERLRDNKVAYLIQFKTPRGDAEVEISTEGQVLDMQGKIALESVPEDLMNKAKGLVPNGTPSKAEIAGIENGAVLYELYFKTPAGEAEVEIYDNGKVREIELPPAAVPKAAMDAATKAVPNGVATVAKAEPKGDSWIYDITFDTPDGEVEAEVTAGGKVIEVEKQGLDEEEEDEE